MRPPPTALIIHPPITGNLPYNQHQKSLFPIVHTPAGCPLSVEAKFPERKYKWFVNQHPSIHSSNKSIHISLVCHFLSRKWFLFYFLSHSSDCCCLLSRSFSSTQFIPVPNRQCQSQMDCLPRVVHHRNSNSNNHSVPIMQQIVAITRNFVRCKCMPTAWTLIVDWGKKPWILQCWVTK